MAIMIPPPPSPPPLTVSSSAPLTFSHSITEKLTEDNFLLWRQQTEPAIKGHHLHSYLLNPRIPSPWEQHDQLLLSWLQSTLTSSILTQVIGCAHACELWEKFHKHFDICRLVQINCAIRPSTVKLWLNFWLTSKLLLSSGCFSSRFTLRLRVRHNLISSNIVSLQIPEVGALLLAHEARLKHYNKQVVVDAASINLLNFSISGYDCKRSSSAQLEPSELIGNGQGLSINYSGSTCFPSRVLRNNTVYFEFHPDVCLVKSQATHEVLLRGQLTQLSPSICNIVPTKNTVSFSDLNPSKNYTSFLTWHNRLRHPNVHALKLVLSQCNISIPNKSILDFVQLLVLYIVICGVLTQFSTNNYILDIPLRPFKFWGEFFTKLHNDLGVVHRLICPHTHNQNGDVECKHRHIVELGLTLLHQASLPLKFWDHGFVTVVYLNNRLPLSSINFAVPFQLLFKQLPDYKILWVFGCSCFPLLPHTTNKLDFRSHELIISKDVIFNEDLYPYPTLFPSISSTSSHDCPPSSPSTTPSPTISKHVGPSPPLPLNVHPMQTRSNRAL
ncbi:hypothetical protein CR513_53861, partial [Mucuna pruriens]